MVAMTDGVAGLVGEDPEEEYSTVTPISDVLQYNST